MVFGFGLFYEILGGLLEGLVGLLEGLWGLLPLGGVALYLLRSLGVARMAENTGVSNPWFGWVPLLHEWQCARMGDRTRLSQKKTAFLEKGMLVLAGGWLVFYLLGKVLEHIFLLGGLCRLGALLAALALWVLRVLADYWVYADFEPSRAALYALLSVFRLDGIAKFLLRDNIPVGVTGRQDPLQPKYGAQADKSHTPQDGKETAG